MVAPLAPFSLITPPGYRTRTVSLKWRSGTLMVELSRIEYRCYWIQNGENGNTLNMIFIYPTQI